jgi:hypothetical protein
MGVYVLRILLLVLFLCGHVTSASEKTSQSEESHEMTTEIDLLETEVQVVTLRFHEVEINLLVAGFIMAVVLAKICKFIPAAKNLFRYSSSLIHYSQYLLVILDND